MADRYTDVQKRVMVCVAHGDYPRSKRPESIWSLERRGIAERWFPKEGPRGGGWRLTDKGWAEYQRLGLRLNQNRERPYGHGSA